MSLDSNACPINSEIFQMQTLSFATGTSYKVVINSHITYIPISASGTLLYSNINLVSSLEKFIIIVRNQRSSTFNMIIDTSSGGLSTTIPANSVVMYYGDTNTGHLYLILKTSSA